MELFELERRIVPSGPHHAHVGHRGQDALLTAVPEPSLLASAWDIKYSYDTPKHPAQSTPSGWNFDFPVVADPFSWDQYSPYPPSVHYVVTNYKWPLPAGGSVTMTFTITTTGSPAFNTQMEPSNTGTYPASVWLYFSDKNDGGDQYDRWWTVWDTNVNLAAGTFTLTAPLTHDAWNSVYADDANQTSTDRFAHALAHVTDVGMTFGGGFYKGHGTNVMDGTARFTLISYTANPA